MTIQQPSFLTRSDLESELATAEQTLGVWLDRVQSWACRSEPLADIVVEEMLTEVRYHATTVRTLTELIRSSLT